MKKIKLSQKQEALVDDNMFEYLNKFKWHAHKDKNTFYALRNYKTPEGKTGTQMMHHLVIGILRLPIILKLYTDHIDGNGLNNQRNNLRIVTNRINCQNRKEHKHGKLPGVEFIKRKLVKPWVAYISIRRKKKYLGIFKTEQEAYQAYLKALREI